jgi:hypothetical protein
MGSRVGNRQREQSAWKDDQSLRSRTSARPTTIQVEFPWKKEILLVQQSAVDEYKRCEKGSAMARQEVPPQQVNAGGMRTMKNALLIPERAVELQLRLCVEAYCRSVWHRAYEATLGAIKEYVAGQRWPRMSWSLCRTVCTVSPLFLETNCLARWVCSYMRPSPTRSCTETFCRSGCQETGSISTCYFSRMI